MSEIPADAKWEAHNEILSGSVLGGHLATLMTEYDRLSDQAAELERLREQVAALERRRAAVLSLADRWAQATSLLMPPVVAERLREAVGIPGPDPDAELRARDGVATAVVQEWRDLDETERLDLRHVWHVGADALDALARAHEEGQDR